MTGWFMSVRNYLMCALVLTAGSAVAQPVNITRVETLAAAQLDKVEMILAQQQRAIANGCSQLRILKAEAVSVWEPLVEQNAVPVSGRWSMRYAMEACGEVGFRNIDMRVVGNGGIALDPLVPGSTLTDAKLQADVERSFDMAGKVIMPDCNQPVVVRQTEVRVYPKAPKDRWQEVLIGAMCGRDIVQVVEFLPTKNGTTFKMNVPDKTAK